MSVNERKINYLNSPIELVIALTEDISNDYIPIENNLNSWKPDISENMIFRNHKQILKYLIFKTTEVINKYLSFFICVPVKINPWIIFTAITPTNPLGETPIKIDNYREFIKDLLDIQYYEECKDIQPKLLHEWFNQTIVNNSTPICIKFKYLNNDFFFRIKYSRKKYPEYELLEKAPPYHPGDSFGTTW